MPQISNKPQIVVPYDRMVPDERGIYANYFLRVAFEKGAIHKSSKWFDRLEPLVGKLKGMGLDADTALMPDAQKNFRKYDDAGAVKIQSYNHPIAALHLLKQLQEEGVLVVNKKHEKAHGAKKPQRYIDICEELLAQSLAIKVEDLRALYTPKNLSWLVFDEGKKLYKELKNTGELLNTIEKAKAHIGNALETLNARPDMQQGGATLEGLETSTRMLHDAALKELLNIAATQKQLQAA